MRDQCRRKSPSEPDPGRRPALRVRVHRTGSDLFVQLTGELCARTVETLRAPVLGALRAVPAARLVLDLSRVRMSDRFGLGVLVALRNTAIDVGGRVILLSPGAEIRALLAESGLDRHLITCTGLELTGTQVPVSTRPAPPLPLRAASPALPLEAPPEPAGERAAPEGAEA
ncbi:STAS domain-containing protein [Thermomonospora curvata]|uniref:Anti-sigma-factor antagonist n=1 Tax=Thermomonospora curvata (strain ATCC 19995 / DSM 43183 / JCM 3096 / KCTC 9072 / NBRC 15933 / NCIMB 10081 / Henssen B9) TaxID=471852 RepID=D1A696_THECD|nr:STAS domain-containing protein [Thermomonospora curvata]ACZ00195.1 anti-sigma-factor antagonist [Thermomonospora curvata DSM 43183]